MNDQLLTTCSFLAALIENGTNIYSAVYIPICKRAISLFAKNNNKGNAQDIKEVILKEYGIDIPLRIICNLILAVANSLSRKYKSQYKFNINEDRSGFSFSFKEFSFSEIEDQYDNERRTSNTLQLAFETFANEQGENPISIPSFSEFINKYKNNISAFLSGKIDEGIELHEKSYMTHIRFLQYIEHNNCALYAATKRIFVGSLIASYLESEIDLNAKLGKGISYYLDTQVVLELLDLQSVEATTPTRELVRLIHDTGGNVRLMSITLKEIQSNIQNAIKTYDKINPITTINEACIRSGRNIQFLLKLNANIEKVLQKEYKINVDNVSDADLSRYEKSDDAKDLASLWYNKAAALHDVSAYLYVRDKRRLNKDKYLLQKECYWFVTANRRLSVFNKERITHGNHPEIVLPDELTSLLFLKNPKTLTERVSSIALNELIAQTISEEYPSKELICEFDKAVSLNGDVGNEDYSILMAHIAQDSTIKIYKLLKCSTDDKTKFKKEIQSIIEREKKVQCEKDREIMTIKEECKLLKNENQSLAEKMDALSKEAEEINKEKARQLQLLNNENKKKQNRKTRILYAIIALLIAFIIWSYAYKIYGILKTFFFIIASLGGLWEFLSLVFTYLPKISKLLHW